MKPEVAPSNIKYHCNSRFWASKYIFEHGFQFKMKFWNRKYSFLTGSTLLTDTGEHSKLVHRRKRSKVNAAPPRYYLLFFPTRPSDEYESFCMIQRRVKNTRVHFWTFSPVSVKTGISVQNHDFELSSMFLTLQLRLLKNSSTSESGVEISNDATPTLSA